MHSNLLFDAKTIISFLARGVEFAAALIIGMAAIEATIQSLVLFFKRSAPPEQKKWGQAYAWTLAGRRARI